MQHYERQGYFFNEEIINYYIDLGKKDCSIAKKFRASKYNKKELNQAKVNCSLFHKLLFKILYFLFIVILLFIFWFIFKFINEHVLSFPYSIFWNHNNRFFAVYFKYFLPNSLPCKHFEILSSFQISCFQLHSKVLT